MHATIRNGSHRTRRHRGGLASVLAAVALVAAACSDSAGTTTVPDEASPPQGSLTIVATTTIVGDIVSRVVEGDATVEVIMPAGADPHDFSPSSRQVAAMQEADLVVAVGLLLEEGFTDILEAIDGDGGNVLWLAERLDPIPFDDDHDDHTHDTHDTHDTDDHTHDTHDTHDTDDHTHDTHDTHDHGEYDPHVWMDPLRAGEAALMIAASLEALDPSTDWASRAQAYADELRALDEEIQAILDPIPQDRRLLVTNHHSLGYFADRYGFTVVGTLIPGGATLAAPSPAELSRLVDLIEGLGIPAIFAENIDATALADALAQEVGHSVAVVVLTTDSLGSPDGETGTLVGLLRSNAMLIAEALTP